MQGCYFFIYKNINLSNKLSLLFKIISNTFSKEIKHTIVQKLCN